MINQYGFKKLIWNCFISLMETNKSTELPKTFYTPGRKGQPVFLVLYRARGAYSGLKRELFGQEKRKTINSDEEQQENLP